ncbi:MAG: hypothetical protein G01um10143_685 [Parcubacteria group bacterium Gr01-1014_3]|nr:MAG: hypothetical protein G01um10143_685 [Parcubacteria group bacterium Gr01-1014_3]
MNTKFIETDPAIAKKIMGPDCVTIEEALSIIPSPREYLDEIGPVPFSTETLYRCSEPNNKHVLVPGFYRVGKHPLNIVNMRSFFPEHKPLFAPWDAITMSVVSGLQHSVCPPGWYLLSKDLFSRQDMHKYCARQEMGSEDVLWAENTAVYIYSWLLMKRLRKESLFRGEPFFCTDSMSFGYYKISLQCDENRIAVLPYIYKSRATRDISFGPSLDPESDTFENENK